MPSNAPPIKHHVEKRTTIAGRNHGSNGAAGGGGSVRVIPRKHIQEAN